MGEQRCLCYIVGRQASLRYVHKISDDNRSVIDSLSYRWIIQRLCHSSIASLECPLRLGPFDEMRYIGADRARHLRKMMSRVHSKGADELTAMSVAVCGRLPPADELVAMLR